MSGESGDGRNSRSIVKGITIKQVLKYILGIFYFAAGINHFVHAAWYVKIMPPYLPWHEFLVYLSGVVESVLGLLLLIPKSTRVAAWGLILLLIAIFPANVHMAMHPDLYPQFSKMMLLFRLPLQGILIAAAYWFTRTDDWD